MECEVVCVTLTNRQSQMWSRYMLYTRTQIYA